MPLSDDLERMVERGELSQKAYEKFQRYRFEKAKPGDEVVLTEDGKVKLIRRRNRSRDLDGEGRSAPFAKARQSP